MISPCAPSLRRRRWRSPSPPSPRRRRALPSSRRRRSCPISFEEKEISFCSLEEREISLIFFSSFDAKEMSYLIRGAGESFSSFPPSRRRKSPSPPPQRRRRSPSPISFEELFFFGDGKIENKIEHTIRRHEFLRIILAAHPHHGCQNLLTGNNGITDDKNGKKTSHHLYTIHIKLIVRS